MTRAFSSSTDQVKTKVQEPLIIDSMFLPCPEEEKQPLSNGTDLRITLGAAVPAIKLGDVQSNARAIREQMTVAENRGCDLLLFSDLALTGATCGMLFLQKTLLESCRYHLVRLAHSTEKSSMLTVLTAPLVIGSKLAKAAVWLYAGRVWHMTPLHPSGLAERSVFADPSKIHPESIRALTRELNTVHPSRLSSGRYDNSSSADPSDTDHKSPSVNFPDDTRRFDECFKMEIPLSLDDSNYDHDVFSADFKKDLNTPYYGDVMQRGLSLDDIDPDLERCLREPFEDEKQYNIRGLPLYISGNSAPLHIEHPLPMPAKNLIIARFGRALPLFLLPDAQPEWTGAASAGRQALSQFADDEGALVVYAGTGSGESVGEGVFAGRRLILAGQRILAESDPFTTGVTYATFDIGDILSSFKAVDLDKESRNLSFLSQDDPATYRTSSFFRRKYSLNVSRGSLLCSRFPLVEAPGVDRRTLFTETLTIQAHALAARLESVGVRPVLGLSGGLDSAIAFLVCLKATSILHREPSFVLACSMPGPGSSKTSIRLARTLGKSGDVDFREIPIHRETASHLEAIGHDGVTHDVTYENAQARERTQILMDLSNMEKGLVVGTGDLSEMALGWCTYNGDQMSMYAVNASLSKTVIRLMAEEAAGMLEEGALFPDILPKKAQATVASALREILARPVSPELVPPNADDSLRQITEDAVGPYELVDFFLWHFVFLKEKPSEILDLAEQVFNDTYTRGQLKHWLTSFIRRFFNSQFKRKATPDGVACFPWQLVPISTWYMPSDASSRLWLDDLLDDLGENHDLS
ncbi:MAG: NAD(+) synthase [Clostridiaceae bacterium]|jgi:NAD+ synthase (glutamine-hydrolysing)|nr:NAD(+) synthase [Clostridiaceae bacterium]